jgi:hypothetical protein
MSPGWYWSSVAAGAREVATVGDTTCVVSSDGEWLKSTTYSAGSNPVDTYSTGAAVMKIPAFEPPIRVNFPASTRGIAVANWALPSSTATPTVWGLLSVAFRSTTLYEYPSLFICNGDTLRQQSRSLTASDTITYRACTDYTTGTGYILKHNPSAGNVVVYIIQSGTTNLFTLRTFTSNFTTGRVRDVACTTYNGVIYWALLGDNGHAYVYKSTSATEVANIVVARSPVQPLTEICLYQDMLLRCSTTGSIRLWQYTAGTPCSAERTIGSAGDGRCAVGKQTLGTSAYVTLETTDPTTGDTDCSTYSVTMAVTSDTTAPTANLLGVSAKSTYITGAPFPVGVNNAFFQCANNATLLRSHCVRQAQSSANRAMLLSQFADGVTPARGQIYQGGQEFSTNYLASSSPVPISIRDSLCGEAKSALVFTGNYVTGGLLSGSNCDLAPFAAIVAKDSAAMATTTKCAVEFDSLCRITIDDSSVAWLCGHPWIDGCEQIATGFTVDGPPLVIASVNSTSLPETFTTNAVYQYCARAEYRNSKGTLFRSAPTQPTVYIEADGGASPRHNSHTLTIGWPEYTPTMPGSILRIFRTVAGGSVFYDIGTVGDLGTVITTITDSTPDSTLIGNKILTEGPAVTGGLKSKYGFPPCRFGWRGKDRVAVGGLEQPNQVRWSQLIYPGEAICFPHASEQGWIYDFPEPITAVASLDDVWIVFSATRIWAIYGCGPDDNGMSGAFDPPRVISTSCGAVTWRSIAETPEGLLFQAPDAQIYLLQRGQLTTQWFSAPVRLELSRGMLGTKLRNPIVAALPHNAGQTVHFVRAPMSGTGETSPVIVFDKRTNAWTLDSSTDDGINGALSGANVSDVWLSASPTGNDTVCTVTPTHVTVEGADDAGRSTTPSGAAWTPYLVTNDIAPFGVGGWGKCQRIGIIGEMGANDTYSLSLWQNRKQSATADVTGSPALADYASSDMPFLSWAPAVDKASAVRLKVSWGLRSTYPAAIVLQVEPLMNTERTAAGRRA